VLPSWFYLVLVWVLQEPQEGETRCEHVRIFCLSETRGMWGFFLPLTNFCSYYQFLQKDPSSPTSPDWKTDPIANQSTHPCKHRRHREDRPSHLLYLLHYQSPPPLQTRPLPLSYVSFLLDQNRVELLMLFPSNRPSLVIPLGNVGPMVTEVRVTSGSERVVFACSSSLLFLL
jgi:hypothetical protein